MTTPPADSLTNIGPAGRRRRTAGGMIALTLAAAVVLGLESFATVRWWRLAAFPLIWFGMLGLLQASARTCVAHAARGTCELDVNGGRLTPSEANILEGRGKIVLRNATIAAIALTAAIVLLIPDP